MADELSKKVIMGFVLLCIVAVIMFLVINRLKNEYWDFSDKQICKKSVELAAQNKQYLTIKGNHLTDSFGNPVDLKCATDYITEKSEDDKVIKRRIADAMAKCWDQYGRGEFEIFDTKDNNYCVICSSLDFKNKKEITDFTSFLIKEKPSVYSDKSYFKFLSGVKAKDNEVIKEYENSALKKDRLSLEDPLAVIFVMGKDAYPDSLLPGVESDKLTTLAWGTGIGLVGGYITGVILCSTGIGCVAGAGILATTISLLSTTASGITGAFIGANAGFIIGSDSSAEWDASIILWNYKDLASLDKCKYLGGESTPLKPFEMDKYK